MEQLKIIGDLIKNRQELTIGNYTDTRSQQDYFPLMIGGALAPYPYNKYGLQILQHLFVGNGPFYSNEVTIDVQPIFVSKFKEMLQEIDPELIMQVQILFTGTVGDGSSVACSESVYASFTYEVDAETGDGMVIPTLLYVDMENATLIPVPDGEIIRGTLHFKYDRKWSISE